jgi:hypothetical protein
VVPAALHNTSVRLVESLKLFANPSFWWLEIGSGPDYHHGEAGAPD